MEERKYATECGGERHKHIKGINCDVQSCVYHDGKSECYAGEICVDLTMRNAPQIRFAQPSSLKNIKPSQSPLPLYPYLPFR